MARKDERAESIPENTDVAIIGAGPGGYAAAFEAAGLGLDVTLINEEEKVGGVCLQRGCIPSKALLHITELIHATEQASTSGVTFSPAKIDADALRKNKDRIIDQLTGGLGDLCKQRGVRLIRARATFAGEGQLELEGAGRDTLGYKQAIVATGSRPVALPDVDFANSERIMDSTGALALKDIPKTLLIVGGGYIGLEMGMVYQSLGSKVTLVEMADRLMPNTDADLLKPLAAKVEERFEAVHLKTQVAGLHETKKQVRVTLENDEGSHEKTFERVLIAVGRQPNTEELGLDNTQVTLDDNGFIEVDEQRRTRDESIFAIGDIAGGMLLAHEAMHEGKVAARVIAGQSAAFDARAVPAVVYTVPQLAWCGLTEQQAEAEKRDYKALRFPWQASGRALTMGAEAGMTKLLVEPDTGRILGMGIVGPHAESLIAEGVLAIEMGAVAEDLAMSVHPHPTLTETTGEAAELFLGSATHYG
ncbi:dihydrolipoamide dehydrogenase [Modicisalibacter muralis]|uniref:Dihydrolipoyl dehydrogenase n=1 Tax=Modicisalibacter muralis TaxID=119000 RepID=A0A1G9GIF3_9GAMM|nr:dihydrolipoyl dehydrogenase [Halomonas muralis]SDL00458.1 dihydrolipoamide dehydrogenase [Halomonas muralis]